MNSNGLAKMYSQLTPEERFRLVLAAGARGDKTEQQRLANGDQRITVTMEDRAPYHYAFREVGTLVFMELLELVVQYVEAASLGDAPGDTKPHRATRSVPKRDGSETSDWQESLG